MDMLKKGRRMHPCTRQPPEPQYALAVVLGDLHMVPPSALAAILKMATNHSTLQGCIWRQNANSQRSVHIIQLL